MAEKSEIAWTKSTLNPWIGCTKVGPGCDACYAEALDKRHKWGGATHWGAGVPRHRTSESYWRKPLAWNKQAPASEFAGIKGFWPVFCASLADVFDNEVPDQWRHDLFSLIQRTPNLSWLLVTKRIGNVLKLVDENVLRELPNIRLMITVVNQEEADRDIPKLLALPCKNGISYEPALGPIDFGNYYLAEKCGGRYPFPTLGIEHRTKMIDLIDWIIVGGESNQGKQKARPFNVQWARSTVQQCANADVPVFVKQLGAHPYDGAQQSCDATECCVHDYTRLKLSDRAGADPSEWDDELRVQEFPL